MRTRTLVAIVALLVPSALAQDPQQVVKLFAQQAKQKAKSYQQNLAAIGHELDAQVEIFQLSFATLQADDGPIEDFVAALDNYQLEASGLASDAGLGIGTLADDALAALAEGGADESVHPTGLVLGDGGALDDALAAVQLAAAKADTAVVKKLTKLAAKLRKATDMRLGITLRPVEPWIIAPPTTDIPPDKEHTLAIDLVVSFNRGGVDNDGRLWMGGSADAGQGSVNFIFLGTGFFSGVVAADAQTSRWLAASDPMIQPLGEGNYMAKAHQSSGSLTQESVGMP